MIVADFVVPAAIADSARPSGGNRYDLRVSGLLPMRVHYADARSLPVVCRALPDGATVLVDGLLAPAAPSVLLRLAERARLIVLLHMPRGDADEDAVVRSAAGVVATSEWTRQQVLRRCGDVPVWVAVPGADPAPLTSVSAAGVRLMCLGAVAEHKGQDVLAAALALISDLPCTCACVGSLEVDPVYAASLRGSRLRLAGPRAGAALARSFARTDLLVVPSRVEAYGMVVTEALARGIPVLASDVGGVSEALGATTLGRPGMLVPPGDAGALARALRMWLTLPRLREDLRAAARERRDGLPTWAATAHAVREALNGRGAVPVSQVGRSSIE